MSVRPPVRIIASTERAYETLKSIDAAKRAIDDPRIGTEVRGRLLARQWMDEIRERVAKR